MIVHLRGDDIVFRQRQENVPARLKRSGSDDAGTAGADVGEFDDVRHDNFGAEFPALNPEALEAALYGIEYFLGGRTRLFHP
jgi:hypothetical protein